VTGVVSQVLILVMLFQCKHAIADFLLQSRYILANRHRYGHPGGLLHVLFHLIGSAAVFLLFGTGASTLFLLLIFEGLFHYHLDWAKDNYVRRADLKSTDYMYWVAIGIDQALHHLSYVGLIWLWLLWQVG